MGEWKERLAAIVLLGGVLAGFGALSHWISWHMVDDAGISLAFGRSLFEGAGARITPASQTVEGFSSPLWMLWQGFGTVVPVDPVAWSRWSGVCFGAIGLTLASVWAPSGLGRRFRVEDALAPAIAALNPSFGGWAASGMELGLWVLCVCGAGVVVLRAMAKGSAFRAGAVVGALLLVRPEAPLLALATAPVWAAAGARRGRMVRELGQLAAGWLTAAGCVFAARWWWFRDVVPNTYWAKRNWEFGGFASVGDFLHTYQLAASAAGAGLLVALLWRRFKVPHAALAASWCVALLAFATKGDWMGEWRFAVPVLPLLGVVAASGVDAARLAFVSAERPSLRRLAAGSLLALTALLSAALFDGLGRRAQVKASPQFGFESVRATARGLASELETLGQRRVLLGLPDLGGLAWELRSAELMDPAGLCDRSVATQGPNLAALDDYFSNEGPPAVVDVHGPSGYLAALPRLMGGMEHRGGALWFVRGLSATEDPRCPDGKAQALATDATGLRAALAHDLDAGDAVLALRRWRCARAYLSDERLPDGAARRELVARASERSEDLERAGQLEAALRHASFAAVVSDHEPAKRRRAESLRARLFSPPAGATPSPR